MRITALTIPVVLALTLAAPAHARQAPADWWVRATPNPLVIYGDRPIWLTINARLGVPATDVLAEIRSTKTGSYDYANLTDPDHDGTWTGRIKLYSFEIVGGKWRIDATGTDGNGQFPGPTGAFVMKGYSKVTAKAPKVVHRGARFRVSGRLTIAGDGTEGKQVGVYYRKAGTKKWVWKGRVKTGFDGVFGKTFTASQSGTWRTRIGGTSTFLSAVSKSVTVKVRR